MVPTGTVTFLFSDIEGSTERWETHPDAMRAAVARHETLMREAISRHGGYIFKTLGDAFCCAFATAPNALHAAVDTQRAHGTEDFSAVNGLRVRIGLHTGHADEHDADYFGPAVNRVARLTSIGHGSQVLLSDATRALVQNEAPPDTIFTDLGVHRLKDLAQPERVWQVTPSGHKSDFPPLKSLDALPNNLPMQVTSFRGRESDLEDLKLCLVEHRLITLVGAGGVGKTRLAVQLGAEVADRFPDGVWISDLAPIAESDLVSSVVAKTLGVSQAQVQLSDDCITQALRTRQLLLVLDNCEQVLETAAALADAIHCHCPSVRIVATSRQALGVRGEKVVRLDSLAVPEALGTIQPAAALEFGAVALFVDRASLVDRSFRLGADNAHVVADICRRLDGIPLAIELAAARVNVMNVRNLAQRLDERFKVLTGGSRTALPRQKTLAALFDWSYDLLGQQERLLFDRAAIFAGSFSHDAVASVCADDEVEQLDVLDLIASLADKSLMVVDTSGSQERYRMLRHADYFCSFARQPENKFGAVPLNEWLARLEPELENFRATMDWALVKGHDVALGACVALALQMYWWHGGVEAEGLRWIQLALHDVDEARQPDIAVELRQALARLMSRVLFS